MNNKSQHGSPMVAVQCHISHRCKGHLIKNINPLSPQLCGPSASHRLRSRYQRLDSIMFPLLSRPAPRRRYLQRRHDALRTERR